MALGRFGHSSLVRKKTVRVFPVISKSCAFAEPELSVEILRGVVVRHGSGFQAQSPIAAAPGFRDDVSQEHRGDALPESDTHRPDYTGCSQIDSYGFFQQRKSV